MSTLALACHPHPLPVATLALVKQAKASLNLNYLVAPIAAVPGTPTRVLALTEPPFLCDYALIRNPDDYNSVRGALEWVLEGDIGDPRAVRVLDMLRGALGDGVNEVTVESDSDTYSDDQSDESEGVVFK